MTKRPENASTGTERFRQLVTERGRRITRSIWNLQPQNHEHALPGRLPFDVLFLPQQTELLPLERLVISTDGRERLTDNEELEQRIRIMVDTRQEQTRIYNEGLLIELAQKGIVSEEDVQPLLRKFFNGPRVRLHPDDIVVTQEGSVHVKLGQTEYFTYAGARSAADYQAYNKDGRGYDRLGLVLAVCAIMTGQTQTGEEVMLYTVRGTANETYAEWEHAIGGTVDLTEGTVPNPQAAIEREIQQESGLKPQEFQLIGIEAIVMNTTDIHPEIIYQGNVATPIEQWLGQRHTDKEVDIRYFTLDANGTNLRNFIIGQRMQQLQTRAPIVPSGLAGYLFFGRTRYGEKWYKETLAKIPQY